MMKKMKEKEEGRNWAELDEDILGQVILRRLPRQDYFRFGAVCRPWSEVQRKVPPPPIGPLPWILLGVSGSSSSSTSTYGFYDPWEKKERSFSYPLQNKNKIDYIIATLHDRWLLSHVTGGDVNFIGFPFLLINPFSGSRIQLPNMRFNSTGLWLSAPPTDPDCVVVRGKASSLASCRLRDGEQGWRSHDFVGSPKGAWKDAVFCNGSFYAIDHRGRLGVLDLPGMEDRVLNMDSSQLPMPIYGPDIHVHLVVSLGEILMVVAKFEHKRRIARPDVAIHVFRADLTAKTWESVQTLKDRLLFLTDCHSISLSASTVGVPGDRIFLTILSNWGWIEYCLSDGSKQFHHATNKVRISNQRLFWVMPPRP